jgi:hypothetical protein
MRVDEPFGSTSIPPRKDCSCIDCPFDEPPMGAPPPPPPPPTIPLGRTGEFRIVADSRGAGFLESEAFINAYAPAISQFLHNHLRLNGSIRQSFQPGDENIVASIFDNQRERLEAQLPAGYRAANSTNEVTHQLTRIRLPGPGIHCQQNPQDPEGDTLFLSDSSWAAFTSMRARIPSEPTSETILSISPWQEEWDVPARNTFDVRRLKTSRRYRFRSNSSYRSLDLSPPNPSRSWIPRSAASALREWDYPSDQHEDRLQNEESNNRSRASRSFVLPAPFRLLKGWRHRLNSTARLSLKFLRERIIRRETELVQNRRNRPANDSDIGSVTDLDSDDESTLY